MANVSKFEHIVLGRAFRPVVLAHIKGLPTWDGYRNLMGWRGKSEDITNPEIKAACEALGVDLDAMWLAFGGSPVTVSAQSFSGMVSEATAAHAAAEGAALAHVDAAGGGDESEGEPTAEDEGDASDPFEGRNVDDVIAEALAPATVHMSAHLANMLPGLVRPAFERAVQGPRVVTMTIAGTAAGQMVSGFTPPVVNVRRRVPLGQAFGFRKGAGGAEYAHALSTIMVDVCDYVDAPAVDPDYVWTPEVLVPIAAQDAGGMNAWIWGDAGTGKSEGMRQYAARLGRPFVRIPIEHTTEPSEIIGQEGLAPNGGGMEWRDGKLTRAFRVPRCVILLDEPSLLRSGTLSCISTALDMRQITTVSGEVVKAAPGVFIVAADNTAGVGDDSGRYVDTGILNAAFLDRFALRTEFKFLPAATELGMLMTRTGLDRAAVGPMVDYAGVTRSNATSGKLTMGLTTRRLLAWAKTVKLGLPSAIAFRAAIVDAASAEDKATLEMLADAGLKSQHGHIDAVARGLPVTVDPMGKPISATAVDFAGHDDDEAV